MLFEFDDIQDLSAKIKVLGVGGAGCNALNRMISSNMEGVEFIAVNTDAQALGKNRADTKLQIGRELTRGKGAGAVPEKGKQAALESKDSLVQVLEGSDLIFITAGMGGGTGTGAAPVVAELAKNTGALVVGIVTHPFKFEGLKRAANARQGIDELRDKVDALIVVQNEKLLEIVGNDTAFEDAFLTADSILNQATKGISDLIIRDGLINLDMEDVKTVMTGMGDAIMGIGTASGPSRAVMAATLAISSPLLDDVKINGAKGVLINFSGGRDLKLSEVNEAAEIIRQEAGDNANIIFGTVIDPEMNDEIQITVIATGFNSNTSSTQSEVFTVGEDFGRPDPGSQGIEARAERKNTDQQIPYNRQQMPGNREKTPIPIATSDKKSVPPVFGGEDLDIPAFIRRQKNSGFNIS